MYICTNKISNMNRKIVLVLIAIMLLHLPLLSQSSNGNSKNAVAILLKDPTRNNNRPKAPSKQFIECWYGDGELSFDFTIPEGMCNLNVTDGKSGLYIIMYSILLNMPRCTLAILNMQILPLPQRWVIRI